MISVRNLHANAGTKSGNQTIYQVIRDETKKFDDISPKNIHNTVVSEDFAEPFMIAISLEDINNAKV